MELQEKLSTLRKQHKITQMELADKLGVSRQAVSKWEQGTAFPSTENLIQLGKLYGVSIEVLTTPELTLDGVAQQKTNDTPPAEAKPNTSGTKRLIAVAAAGILLGGLIVGMVAFSGGTKVPEETTPIKDLDREVITITDGNFEVDTFEEGGE